MNAVETRLLIREVAEQIYNELAYEFFIESHDIKKLTEKEEDELLDLWDKIKKSNEKPR